MARGFTRGAGSYERSRPGYPPGVVRFAQRTFHLGPGSTIVDLAAGTGKLTRALLPTRARIIAIEPLSAMRRQFRQAVPSVRVRPGTAERTGLPSASADLVTVGQAFHWFDAEKALREIHRILRPGGGLMVVYNWRDERGGWRRAINRLAREYDYRTVPHHRDWGGWKPRLMRDPGLTRARVARFRHAQRLTRRLVEDRYLSISYLAALPPARKAEFLRRLRQVLANAPSSRGRRVLLMTYTTRVHWCLRREAPLRGAPRRRRRMGRTRPR